MEYKNEILNNIAATLSNTESDKILVLIQLFGGNDGLNSFIPLDQYDQLQKHRSNILIKENKILKISDDNGFHPKLSEFQKLYNNGKLCCIQNVGYPNQNRSHFRSMDIWNSGSPADIMWSSGWLGRFLDKKHDKYPSNYPTADYPDPLAITIGNIVADTCQGKLNNFSFAINKFEETELLFEHDTSANLNKQYINELLFLNSTIKLTNKYTEKVLIAANRGNNLNNYKDDNKLAQQLKMVSKLISGGLNTKIYNLILGGFDTHAYQTMEETDIGFHATQLETLSKAVGAFQEDLVKLNLAERVLTVTYSEFGRQIASNASKGTDHGSAAPIFVFGNHFKNQIIGNNPIIKDEIEAQAGVNLEYDFRDVYATILNKWFNIDVIEIESIFERKPIILNNFL